MNLRTGLSDKTWTCGLYHPKVARYQLRHTQMSYKTSLDDLHIISHLIWFVNSFFEIFFIFFVFLGILFLFLRAQKNIEICQIYDARVLQKRFTYDIM